MLRPPFFLPILALLAGLLATGCRSGVEQRLAAAQALQDEGQFQQSIGPLGAILAEAPDHAEANYLLGVALVRTGRLAPSVQPLRTASEGGEFGVVAGQLLTSVLISTKSFDEARAAASRLLERDPDSTGPLRLRAQAALGARQYEEALADIARVLEAEPTDFAGLHMRAAALSELERWEDCESTLAELRAAAMEVGDPTTAARACIALGAVREQQEDLASAAARFEACVVEFPSDPLVISRVADFELRQGRPETAEALWRSAVERAPESLLLRRGLGRQIYAEGDTAGAIETLRQAGEDLGTPQAWLALADLQRRSEDLAEAEESLQKAIESGGSSEVLRFQLAGLRVDRGDFEGAEELADGFTEEAYGDVIRARVRLLRGEPAAALAALEAGLARRPDNALARSLAGRAAQQLGDYERAFEEYRLAIRADGRATDAAYAAAHLARSLGRPDDALGFARSYLTTHPYAGDPQPLVIAIESSRATDNDALADQYREALVKLGAAGDARAVAALARVDRVRSGPEAALRAVAESGLDLTDPANEPALRAQVDAQVQQGRAAEALAHVDRALAADPEAPALLDLQGRALAALGRSDEARASFERAVAADASFAPSLAALGALTASAADRTGALSYYDRAAEADPSDAESAYRAAQIVLAQGRSDEAERRLRGVVAKAPGHPGACNDLAWVLAQAGRELDLALALAQRGLRLSSPPARVPLADTLAFVRLERGEAAAAVEILEEALERSPASGTLRYRLGLARAALGEREAALDALREALRDSSFGEADAARAEIARLQASSSR